MKTPAAIVGVGSTAFGDLGGRRADDLAADAAIVALDDAGLAPGDVDGLVAVRVSSYETLAGRLGVESRWSLQVPAEGRMTGVAVAAAKRALEAGDCSTVLVLYGNDGRSGGHSYGGRGAASSAAGEGYGTAPDLTRAAGLTSPGAFYALMWERYRHLHGVDDSALGRVACTIRQHAAANPGAVMRTPFTLDDYLTARYIVRPLRLLDYCLVNDGGIALVLTTGDRARDTRRAPVYVRGVGQAGALRSSDHPPADFWRAPVAAASNAALREAAIVRADVNALQVYDNFSPNVLFALEGMGHCGPGEAASWWAEGHGSAGGRLPVNTSGGHLSESYMQGWGLLAEAVRQLTGRAGERQVAGVSVVQYVAPAPISTSLVLSSEAW